MHCPTLSGLWHDAFCTVQVADGQKGRTSTTLNVRIAQVECPVQNAYRKFISPSDLEGDLLKRVY